MSQQGRIRKDSLALITANLSTAFTQAIIAIAAARVLSPEEFGRYAIGLSAAALCIAASDGGVGVIVTRELAQGVVDPRTLVRRAFVARGVLAVIVIAAGWLLAPLFFDSPATVAVMRIGLLTGGLGALSALCRAIFTGVTALRQEAMIQLAERALLLVLSLAALSRGSALDLLMVALVSRGAGLAARLVLQAMLPALRQVRERRMSMRTLIGESGPLGAAILLATIYFQVAVLMLGAISGETTAGVYQAAVSILLLAYLIPESVSVALVPAFSRAAVTDRTQLAATFTRAASDLGSIGIGAGLVLLTMGPLIASVLYPSMTGVGALVQILALACMFRFVSYALSALMPSIGYGRTRLVAAGIAAVVNVVLNLILIPPLGAQGAALVAVVTEAVLLATYLASVPRSLMPIHMASVLRPVGLGMGLALVAGLTMAATGVGLMGLVAGAIAWELIAAVRTWERPSQIGVRMLGGAVGSLGFRQ